MTGKVEKVGGGLGATRVSHMRKQLINQLGYSRSVALAGGATPRLRYGASAAASVASWPLPLLLAYLDAGALAAAVVLTEILQPIVPAFQRYTDKQHFMAAACIAAVLFVIQFVCFIAALHSHGRF